MLFFQPEEFGVPPTPCFILCGLLPQWVCPWTGFVFAPCGRRKVLHNWLMSGMQQEFAQDK